MLSPTRRRPALTARQACATGILFMAFGAWLVVVGTGAPHIAPSKDIPLWMVGLCGAMFTFAGGAMFVRYRYLGASDSGDDAALTGSAVARSIQAGLALAAVGCMCAVCGWIAFGPGPRHFHSTSSIPFITLGGERAGRIGFGIATTLLAAGIVVRLVTGLRALLR
jgi:hypothetical protein